MIWAMYYIALLKSNDKLPYWFIVLFYVIIKVYELVMSWLRGFTISSY